MVLAPRVCKASHCFGLRWVAESNCSLLCFWDLVLLRQQSPGGPSVISRRVYQWLLAIRGRCGAAHTLGCPQLGPNSRDRSLGLPLSFLGACGWPLPEAGCGLAKRLLGPLTRCPQGTRARSGEGEQEGWLLDLHLGQPSSAAGLMAEAFLAALPGGRPQLLLPLSLLPRRTSSQIEAPPSPLEKP